MTGGYGREGGGVVGEDEKTWGASFDAVNVQIYVEGQWSTLIRSSSQLLHPSTYTTALRLPVPPPSPPQAFSFLPLLSLTVPPFSPLFFPRLSSVGLVSLLPSPPVLWKS